MKILSLDLSTKFLYQPGKNSLHTFDNLYVVYLMIFPNNKIYCGYSGNLVRRWQSKSRYNKCPLVNKAIEKYGWENIQKYVIFSSSIQEDALKKEAEIIEKLDLLNPKKGYNLIPGGGALPHPSKLNLSQEQIQHKRQCSINQWKNPNIANFMKQRMKEETHKSRMKKTPQERKEIWGKHNLGRKPANAKSILQIDLATNKIIKEYSSARQAAIALGLDPTAGSNIQRTARGIGKSAYGYNWRWKE